MDTSSLRQRPEIAGVGGEDVIAIRSKANKSCIYGVDGSAPPQEDASSFAELLVDCPHVHAAQQTCDLQLTPRPTAPNLGYDATVAQR